MYLFSRYRHNNLTSQITDSESYTSTKCFNWLNAKTTSRDTQYVSRVLILIYSKSYAYYGEQFQIFALNVIIYRDLILTKIYYNVHPNRFVLIPNIIFQKVCRF